MKHVKQTAIPLVFIVTQCFVLYALWPDVKRSFKKTAPKNLKEKKTEKKVEPSFLLAAIFNVKKKKRLQRKIVLSSVASMMKLKY